MLKSIRQQLVSLPLFAMLTDDEAQRMATVSRHLRYTRGESLFTAGSAAHGIYIVLEGLVKIYRLAPNGREMMLHLIAPGQSCGNAAVFLRGVYPASGQAVRASQLLYVPGDALVRTITDNPELALRMLASLSERLKLFACAANGREHGSAAARLASYVLNKITDDQDTVLMLETSRETLGSLLGMTRETVSRELARLRQGGIITVQGRELRVLDRSSLQKIANTSFDPLKYQ